MQPWHINPGAYRASWPGTGPYSNPPYDYSGRTNQRPQLCQRCKEEVGAEEGVLVKDLGVRRGSPWTVWHATCAPPEIQDRIAAMSAPPVFTFDTDGQDLVIHQPDQRLPRDQFDLMRSIASDCCRSTQRDGKWVAVAPLIRAAEIADQYRAAGFNVAVTPALEAAIQGASASQGASMAAAMERAEDVDRILYDVGMQTQGTPFSLYDYQRTGIQWLAGRNRALLADDQGLGKTIQSAVAIPNNAPAVIVAPVPVLLNWAREMARWRPERAAGIQILGEKVKGQPKVAAKDSFVRWPGPGETFITSYTRLPKKLPGPPLPGTYLICDEAQNLKTLRVDWRTKQPLVGKSKSSQRAANFYRMSQAVLKNDGAVWLLSGTPIMNRANELWSVLQQANLEEEAFGTFNQFIRDFNIQRGGYANAYQWDDAVPGPQVAGKLQRVMLRREKADALPDLPPKEYQDVKVPIDPKSAAELDAMADGVLAYLETEADRMGEGTAEQIALLEAADSAAQKVREGAKLSPADQKVLSGTASTAPGFEELAKARKVLATAKIPAMVQMVEGYERAGEPILVFSSHLAPLHVLAARPGWAIIEGKTKAKDRQKVIDAFQAGKLKGVALSINAAGVGITLTRSNIAIFLDKAWTPAGNVQAEDRIHRIGQMRQVRIISLLADHAIDKRVNQLLTRKAQLIRQTISAGRRGANEIIVPSISLIEATPEAMAPTTFDLAEAGYAPGPAHPEMARAEYERIRAEDDERERGERIEARRRPTQLQLADAENRRMPATQAEAWAAQAIADLSRLDWDMVALPNEMGWSAANSSTGHQFNALLGMGLGLTEEEWRMVFSMLRIHRSQVGLPPTATEAEQDEAKKAAKKAEGRRKRAAKKAKTGGRLKAGLWVDTPAGPGVVLGKEGKGKALRWLVQLQGGEQAAYPRKALSVIEEPVHGGAGAERLWIRVSDNVLDPEQWGVTQLDLQGGVVRSVSTLKEGVYRDEDAVPAGTSLAAVAAWSQHDPTGEHPEAYHEVWIPGEGAWRAALGLEELREVARQGASAPTPNPYHAAWGW